MRRAARSHVQLSSPLKSLSGSVYVFGEMGWACGGASIAAEVKLPRIVFGRSHYTIVFPRSFNMCRSGTVFMRET